MTPEQKARIEIDKQLIECGYVLQDMSEINPSASKGVIVREHPTDTGPVDYLIFIDKKPVGVIEAKEINKGDSWDGESLRAIDPLDDGNITVIPMYVHYTYLKDEFYNNQEVYLLKAEWATRYGGITKYIDVNGDPNLSSANGKHTANIYVSKENGAALIIRDTVDETFVYKDKTTVAFKGTITLFTEYPSTVNEEKLLPVINRITEQNDIEYERTKNGIKLTIKALQFVADKAELLPGEEKRLNEIAGLLKQITTNQFLVEGHTARVGDESNELELSLDRAHSIVNELVKRGVPSENFICKGSGGTKPIADNSTEEGRARNRRVEITILY